MVFSSFNSHLLAQYIIIATLDANLFDKQFHSKYTSINYVYYSFVLFKIVRDINVLPNSDLSHR